ESGGRREDRACPGAGLRWTPCWEGPVGLGQPTFKFSADSFPRLLTTSYWMLCPSLRLIKPARSTAEMWLVLGCPKSRTGGRPRGDVSRRARAANPALPGAPRCQV